MTMNEKEFPLTYYRLRFDLRAETPIRLGGMRAGSYLRGALVEVMRRATCPYSVFSGKPSFLPEPNHSKNCPVCWLVSANENPGTERRGYVLTPPISTPLIIQPGEPISFHLTLLGNAQRYLPYFVLAVPEAGKIGVGEGRGRFSLTTIFAEYPKKPDWCVLQEGENILRPPLTPVTHADLQTNADLLSSAWGKGLVTLWIDFLTPLRLIWNKRLVKSPDFAVLFSRLLERLDELSMQFARGTQRPIEERNYLFTLAQKVRLLESNIHWQEISSGSRRTGKRTWISGIVGSALYCAPADVWRALLPWLLWGEVTQVGKDAVKGNGVLRISHHKVL